MTTIITITLTDEQEAGDISAITNTLDNAGLVYVVGTYQPVESTDPSLPDPVQPTPPPSNPLGSDGDPTIEIN